MKKKVTNYLLIAAVVFLWGMIIYRVFDAVSITDEPIIKQQALSVKKPPMDYESVKDTTHLLLNYRNPFQAQVKSIPKEIPVTDLVRKSPVSFNPIPHRPVQPFNWGFISYAGYIRNASSKKLLAIVNISGKEYMMTEGDVAGQVKLLKNLKDSIKVSFEGKSKFIAMNTK